MKFLMIWTIVLLGFSRVLTYNGNIVNADFNTENEYVFNLSELLGEIMSTSQLKRCFAIITDAFHHSLYSKEFFRRNRHQHPYFYMLVPESEDLLAPQYQTVKVLHHIRAAQCDLHFVTLLNGGQVKRFLRFIDRYRVLNTSARFVLLYDSRILEADMLPIWSNIVASIFLKRNLNNRFAISTIAYPSILNGIVVTKQLIKWQSGMHVNNVQLFPDKTNNLKGFGILVPVAVYVHVPMVMREIGSNKYRGLEVEIIEALGKALNFKPYFYEAKNSENERWGQELRNGSFTGLIGQLHNRSARFAIGDLHMYKLYSTVVDLSWPHSMECLTFLTPESSQDDSWRTLIQPFSGEMWTGVILSLVVVGIVFYFISYVHAVLLDRNTSTVCHFFRVLRAKPVSPLVDQSIFRNVKFRSYLSRLHLRQRHNSLDLFDSFANCILLTYSMLLYVALPHMPRNWPLRVLTGWYWLYCILVTVTYRASLTAILANPAARITIDTLEDLLRSRVTTTVGERQGQHLFEDAFDLMAREIGVNMELIEDIYEVTEKIAKEWTAYYDNKFFLRHLRLRGNTEAEQRIGNEVLHIMQDCVVHLPVAVGLEKNSPLKIHVDRLLHRLSESGLITKWLHDAISDLPGEELPPQEAVVNLRKIWSAFVVLVLGTILGIVTLAAEKVHFKFVVCKHPLYDQYNRHLYYNFKNLFSKVNSVRDANAWREL